MALLLSLLSYVAAFLAVVLVAVHLFLSRKYDHWKRKGVKYLKPLPIVGNMKDVVLGRKNMGVICKEVYDQNKKEPYIGIYTFDQPLLLINDLNLVRAVLVKDFQYFCDRNFHLSAKVDPMFSRSLLALKGERWRQSRSALTPTFTSGKMKKMYYIIDECAQELAKTLERENKGDPITAFDLCGRYTTDVISSTAFGINGGTLQDPRSEFRRKLKMMFEFSFVEGIKLALAFLAPKLLELANIKVMKQEVEDYVANTINNAIKHREQNGIKRNDLLDSLIEIMRGESSDTSEKTVNEPKHKIKMDEIDLISHSFTFLGAGFETSATTMSYALYELSKRPDIQDKLRAEIIQTLKENEGNMSYDALHSMKYLEMVFQETLRKYPPLSFLDRVSNASYKLPGTELTLEAGSVILVSSLAIHRDPEIYPKPLEFIPERFSEENKGSRASCTHIPFGEGPRACVGMRFALMQVKLGLVHLLKKHTVQRPKTTPAEVDFTAKSFLLQPTEHVRLNFRKIETRNQ